MFRSRSSSCSHDPSNRQYDTEIAVDVIKTWNVETLRFQKNVRHGDRAQFERFWHQVDTHLEGRRSTLAY